jgi:small subunit ribosomal protein S6e
MKINIGEKSGKTYKVDLEEDKASLLYGKIIGEEIDGELIGLSGYTFKITGGSDNSGFPMRRDVSGYNKKKILIGSGVGIRKIRRGVRNRKTVRGNTISEEISQINVHIIKEGPSPLSEILSSKDKGDEKNAA